MRRKIASQLGKNGKEWVIIMTKKADVRMDHK